MKVLRIDSATILVGEIMFIRSDVGQYVPDFKEPTKAHTTILREFIISEKEDQAPKGITESLRGRIIWLN